MKIAFLDRDGTINRDYSDKVWTNIIEPEIIEESITALQQFLKKGYKIIIVTNQYLINEGFITFKQYQNFIKKLFKILEDNKIEILDIFFCPHARKENCACCKPATGLIEQALKKYPSISIKNSFIVGDSYSDILLGNKLGLKSFGLNLKPRRSDNFTVAGSLNDVVKYV